MSPPHSERRREYQHEFEPRPECLDDLLGHHLVFFTGRFFAFNALVISLHTRFLVHPIISSVYFFCAFPVGDDRMLLVDAVRELLQVHGVLAANDMTMFTSHRRASTPLLYPK